MCLLSHNISVYDELENYLSKDNKAIVVLGTSLGKTSTALEYLNRHKCRGLVIVPKLTIENQVWKKYKQVDVITYHLLARNYQTFDYSKYGAIIFDEVHHGAACKWGDPLRYLIQQTTCKVIGLTATPVRGDGVDVREALFERNVCLGLDTFDAIQKGVLWPFKYVSAYYAPADIIAETIRDNNLSTDLQLKLSLALNDTPMLKNIFEIELPKNRRKGIVFVNRISDIEDAQNLLFDKLPNANFFSLHSSMTSAQKQEVENQFNECEEGFLFTVNMAGEGVHFKNINTLIMFRRTMSPVVFSQQLGRIMTLRAGLDPQAVVFDLVNNVRSAHNFRLYFKPSNTLIVNRNSVSYLASHFSNQIIVSDYTEKLTEVLALLEILALLGQQKN